MALYESKNKGKELSFSRYFCLRLSHLVSVSRNFESIESIFLDLLTVVESCQSTPEDKIGPNEILTIHISCVKYVLSHFE